jgi:hypothetical protein
MGFEFAVTRVGTARSILTTSAGRILERLVSARDEALRYVNREDIPEQLRQRFDQIMTQVADTDSLTEDAGMMLATAIEDLSALLDDESRE